MSDASIYKEYVEDEVFMSSYLAYQRRYASQIRESDRILLESLAGLLPDLGDDPVVVDIGCSTGNLLRHIDRALPGLRLVGGEYSRESLAVCRAAEDLSRMTFEEMNVVALDAENAYDVAIVNAVLYMLNEQEFAAALEGLARAIRPGGALMVFDFFHPFPQGLAIREISASHPEGLTLHFRPISGAETALSAAGFANSTFSPFQIPIDLGEDNRAGVDTDFESLNSRTIRTEDGERLLFRGALFQPWCHLLARMPPA